MYTLISENQISQITDKVKSMLTEAEAGHDWLHIERVLTNALLIADTISECNREIVILSALLHDIADSKFHHGDESIGPQRAEQIMNENNVPHNIIHEVSLIIKNISFKGGFNDSDYSTIELDIVRDADRLDAIGAIGIARAFTYGGFKNRRLYDPKRAVEQYIDKEAYKKSTSPTINHFDEKLLKLKDMMKTDKAKQMAKERHHFMEKFLAQFYKETGFRSQ